jgi:hypothetical protein
MAFSFVVRQGKPFVGLDQQRPYDLYCAQVCERRGRNGGRRSGSPSDPKKRQSIDYFCGVPVNCGLTHNC